MKYLILLRYLGTHFCGFQVQPERRTVQGELNRAFFELFGTPCAVTGCSRTDSGVHAEMFCATVEPTGDFSPIPPERLPLAVRRFLPDDLSVYAAREIGDGFHPRYGICEKEYRYDILCTPVPDPFSVGRVWHYPRSLDEAAIARMREAAGYFVGRHDFLSLMAEGGKVADTVRTVSAAEITQSGDRLSFTVRGDGFLYNMVRIMVGTLIEVGEGKRRPEDIKDILAARDRRAAGMTAPPEGLHLARLIYPKGILPE